MASKKNIYVVGYGIDPKSKEPVIGQKFKTWDEAKQYITNVPNAKYKGFFTDEEADAYIIRVREQIFGNGGGAPPSIPVVTTGGNENNNAKVTIIQQQYSEFEKYCMEKHYDPVMVRVILEHRFLEEMKALEELEGQELPFN